LKLGNQQGINNQLVELEEKIRELLEELSKVIESKAPVAS
jgi:hypothetical protein